MDTDKTRGFLIRVHPRDSVVNHALLPSDNWIIERRPERNPVDPFHPYAFLNEEERARSGKIVPVNTIFLTNRECPWRCVMCDLWKNTLTESVPEGAIPAQIEYGLTRLPAAQYVKLYNGGSFFDPRAIPVDDYKAIAALLAPFEHVIVESHPALVGESCLRFRDLLSGRLEVAMGLETVHPGVLPRLNKQMTLEQFRDAAGFLTGNGIDVRAFILVKPPFLESDEAVEWACRSLDFAFDCGVAVATLIPTRSGNDAMESLDFTQPSIAMLEAALEYGIALGKGRVFADLWDLRRFSTCDACYDARAARLHEMNLRQVLVAPIECELSCRATGEPGGADFGGTYKIPQTTVAQPLRLPGRDSSRPPVSQIAPSAETSLGAADTSVCATFFSPSKPDFDLAIIGSGFAGSLLATIARRLGKSVILLESGKHPRFAIGESTTPLSNLLLEELATRYQLPNLLPLCKWGTWRRSHPELACGLKRGFTFYHHQPGCDPARENQLLVAASPRDEIADTHWYRADVDAFFAGEAQRAGVDYRDEVRLHSAREQDGGITLEGEGLAVTARFVVDATGPRGFLHRAFSLPELPLPDMPRTEALYTHFTGVRRLDELHPPSETPPYPVDDAAVHHIFDGGWIWVLRFANGITSAGVAASFGLGQGETAWRTILDRFPTIRAQFAEAEPLMPFIHAPRVSFRSGAIAGRRWALLPSAAGFVDPLLSTGFPLTLLGVARLAEILERDWESPRFEPALLTYARQTEDELLATSRLIGSLYASMANFPVFVARSLLYFAAASFSETARRLGKPHLASSFLLHDNPRFQFQPLLKNACDADEIRRFIEPFNVAGLGDPLRRNWYPADAEDMLRAASKLGASRDELAPLLTRCGFQAVS